MQLVGRLGSGLHRRSAGHAQGAQRLGRPVGALGLPGGGPCHERAGRGLGVRGVMLAVPATVLAARSVDLHHAQALPPQEARQSGPVAARALHPGRNRVAELEHPTQDSSPMRLPVPSKATATCASECVPTPRKTSACLPSTPNPSMRYPRSGRWRLRRPSCSAVGGGGRDCDEPIAGACSYEATRGPDPVAPRRAAVPADWSRSRHKAANNSGQVGRRSRRKRRDHLLTAIYCPTCTCHRPGSNDGAFSSGVSWLLGGFVLGVFFGFLARLGQQWRTAGLRRDVAEKWTVSSPTI